MIYPCSRCRQSPVIEQGVTPSMDRYACGCGFVVSLASEGCQLWNRMFGAPHTLVELPPDEALNRSLVCDDYEPSLGDGEPVVDGKERP